LKYTKLTVQPRMRSGCTYDCEENMEAINAKP